MSGYLSDQQNYVSFKDVLAYVKIEKITDADNKSAFTITFDFEAMQEVKSYRGKTILVEDQEYTKSNGWFADATVFNPINASEITIVPGNQADNNIIFQFHRPYGGPDHGNMKLFIFDRDIKHKQSTTVNLEFQDLNFSIYDYYDAELPLQLNVFQKRPVFSNSSGAFYNIHKAKVKWVAEKELSQASFVLKGGDLSEQQINNDIMIDAPHVNQLKVEGLYGSNINTNIRTEAKTVENLQLNSYGGSFDCYFNTINQLDLNLNQGSGTSQDITTFPYALIKNATIFVSHALLLFREVKAKDNDKMIFNIKADQAGVLFRTLSSSADKVTLAGNIKATHSDIMLQVPKIDVGIEVDQSDVHIVSNELAGNYTFNNTPVTFSPLKTPNTQQKKPLFKGSLTYHAYYKDQTKIPERVLELAPGSRINASSLNTTVEAFAVPSTKK